MAQPPYQPQGYQQPPPQQSWGPPVPAAGPWTGTQRIAGGLLIGGAAVALIAAFLPWVNVSVGGTDQSFNGFVEGASDGYIVVTFSIVALVFGGLCFQANPPRRGAITLGIIVGLLLLFIGIANLANIEEEAPGVEIFGGEVGAGIGLILVTLAGVIVLAGAVAAIVAQRSVNKASRNQGGGGYGAQTYQQPPQGYQPQSQPQPGYQPPQQPPPGPGGTRQ
jgi:hypothetical protein